MEYDKPTLILVGEASAVVLGCCTGTSENSENRTSIPAVLGIDD